MRALSLPDFAQRLQAVEVRLDDPAPLTREEAVEAIRLWNTASYYPQLADDPAVARFITRLQSDFKRRIAPSVDLDVTRGFALRSEESGVTWGGTFPEDSRYQLNRLDPDCDTGAIN